MEFEICRTSNEFCSFEKPYNDAFSYRYDETMGHTWHIKINSIADLRAIQEETKHRLILDFDISNEYPRIRIYDSYIE